MAATVVTSIIVRMFPLIIPVIIVLQSEVRDYVVKLTEGRYLVDNVRGTPARGVKLDARFRTRHITSTVLVPCVRIALRHLGEVSIRSTHSQTSIFHTIYYVLGV